VRKQYYEYRHVVSFDETNLVGDVYDVNYLRWQGRCREMFLLEHTPTVLDELCGDLELITVQSECVHLAEVSAFDEVSVRMRLEELTPTQIGFAFDFVRIREGAERLIAQGRQRVTCLRSADGATAPAPVPAQLAAALEAYAIPAVGGTVRTRDRA
jgi:enediyne biosynthesis thioesterase